MPDALDLPELSGKSVLVVDDNADHLELLTMYFKMCRATVVSVGNAETALACLDASSFHLLVTDLSMPGKDGLDLIKIVRASQGSARTIPAIALTGHYEAYEKDARLGDFNGYLQKPVNPDTLSKIVRNVLDLGC